MSTTKVKSLEIIKSKLELMPGKVFCIEDAELCIDDLYEALRGLIELLEERSRDHRLMKIIFDALAGHHFFSTEFEKWKQEADNAG